MNETYQEFVERNRKELEFEQQTKNQAMKKKAELQGFASDSADPNYIKNNFKVGDVIMYPHWSKDLMKPQVITKLKVDDYAGLVVLYNKNNKTDHNEEEWGWLILHGAKNFGPIDKFPYKNEIIDIDFPQNKKIVNFSNFLPDNQDKKKQKLKNLIYKVMTPDEAEQEYDWRPDAIVVMILTPDGGMYDDHVSHKLEEDFEELDLEEDMEGSLTYYGDLSKQELIDELKSRGFNAQ